ncbi:MULTISPECIES: MerR family transcriptional regulator [Kitasatospora]|uniref:MerR family transcriptional regulator n=1 Tax=Kitasatospora TaxID=2063 RepID=UPI000C6FE2F7|nr:MerR family transcriptional regulator [Kitasatospora sp. GP30]MDH6144846.1 DNA-binding transcriptional MerR regulator [Kitasatospora sp. GP30]
MNGDALYSIGELARRTGLTVKTVRFYSDRGIVSPTDRSPSGYRRYDTDALARLELVRTLRELGLDLATVRKVVERELALPEVAAAHVAALEVQIRTLRLRQAVLSAVAERGAGTQEMELMHRLATLTEQQRRRLIDDFLTAVFGGVDAEGAFQGIACSLTPVLPAEPEAAQLQAWVELAELSQEREFRTVLRRLAEEHAVERSPNSVPRPDLVTELCELVRPALAAGTAPDAPEAAPIAAALVARYVRARGRADDPAPRGRLAERLAQAADPRLARYRRLLAVVNGWPAPEPPDPALSWAARALAVQ